MSTSYNFKTFSDIIQELPSINTLEDNDGFHSKFYNILYLTLRR